MKTTKPNVLSDTLRSEWIYSFPSVFKEGWLRLNKKVPFLILFEITNHPVCAARNGIFLLVAQPPLLENGGEWNRLATKPILVIRPRRTLWAGSKI